MKWVYLLGVLSVLSACASKQEEKSGLKIVGHNPDKAKAVEILQTLPAADKEALAENYLTYYRHSLAGNCSFEFDEKPLRKITSLNIEPAHFSSVFQDDVVIGSIDLTRGSNSENTKLLNMSKGYLSAVLVRSAYKGKAQYVFCALGKGSNVCTKDELVGKLVDIDRMQSMCEWVNDSQSEKILQSEEHLVELIDLMQRLHV